MGPFSGRLLVPSAERHASSLRSRKRTKPADVSLSPLSAKRRHMRRSKNTRYSITSSAIASSVGDTVRPSALAVSRLMTNSSLVGCSTGRSSLAVATKRRPSDSHPHAVGQRRPARTRHRAICDDDYQTNLVRTAPLLRADMIFGKDRSERAGLFLTTRRLATSARTMAQPFVRCTPSSSCFAELWICLSTRQGRGRRDNA